MSDIINELQDTWDNSNDPISKQIKERIKKAGKRFHSNDNISEYINDGEIQKLQAEVQEKIIQDLMELFPSKQWCMLSHLLIFHGRAVCDARKPKCDDCKLADLCRKVGV